MSEDYLGGGDAAYSSKFKVIVQYCAGKTSGSPPAWTHIPQDAMTNISGIYASWFTAYSATLGPHTSQETAEKNRQKVSSEKALRKFVKAYLRYHPAVTDEDRDNMGIPNDDPTRTPVLTPKGQPGADVSYPGPHLIKLTHIRRVAGEEDDPRSEYGTRIFWGVTGAPTAQDSIRIKSRPDKGTDLPHSTFTHRKNFLFDFEGESGQTVWFALRYENRKAGKEGEGPFGPFFSAIIP